MCFYLFSLIGYFGDREHYSVADNVSTNKKIRVVCMIKGSRAEAKQSETGIMPGDKVKCGASESRLVPPQPPRVRLDSTHPDLSTSLEIRTMPDGTLIFHLNQI
ncbi:unnamed protein product [Leptosia nina]|uniref:Uncharacterized protein n=1 Tax=Leptosia nina TaxID=320188 RepID=A0AAV1J7L0_9NEOP